MLTKPARGREGRNMRHHVVRVLGVLALLACAAAPAFAGSDERKGTGGALELRLPVGPRGTALGSAVVGDASGIEALFWNPAGLATIERTQATFSHTQYFADMKLNYAAVGTRVGFGTLAFNAKVLSVGDVGGRRLRGRPRGCAHRVSISEAGRGAASIGPGAAGAGSTTLPPVPFLAAMAGRLSAAPGCGSGPVGRRCGG